MHRYFPHTAADVEAMLQRCGAASVNDLYSDVPEQLRMKGDYCLPPAMSEMRKTPISGVRLKRLHSSRRSFVDPSR